MTVSIEEIKYNDIPDPMVINNNFKNVADEVNEIASGVGAVQKKKITTDTGGATVFVSDTSKDVLTEIVNKGPGLNTIYGIGGSVNSLPSGLSWRGLSFFNAPQFGFVLANDYKGGFHNNYYNNTAGWTGWKKLSTLEEVTLWEGSTNANSGELTLTDKLSNYSRIKILTACAGSKIYTEMPMQSYMKISSTNLADSNTATSAAFDILEIILESKEKDNKVKITMNSTLRYDGTYTRINSDSDHYIEKIVGVID